MPGLTVSTENGDLNSITINTTSSSKLGGTINASEMTKLKDVTVINSGVESLSGGVNLEKIIFSGNSISSISSLYPGVSSFTNLTELILSADNALAGTIPVGSFDNNILLKTLVLNDNSFTGAIPSLSALPILAIANFKNNNFSGQIPALTANKALKQFYSNGNNGLLGPIPSLSGLSLLTNFNISFNGLTGFIHDFHETPLLQTYHAGGNNLKGNLPALSACPNLITADFSENSLSGSLPNLSSNPDLKTFKSYDNDDISGFFPAFPTLNTNFENFDARNNDLSGNLPPLSSTPNLKRYIAARSPGSITGPLPQFNEAPGLTNFEFTGHKLQGNIPSLSANTQLQHFNVNSNALSGEFPHVKSLVNILNLRFNNNGTKLGSPGISGNVPTISACTTIRVFDIANNILTGYAGGPIPDSLENIQAQENNLTAAAVNAILAALVANNTVSPSPRGQTRRCNLGGSNAAPTGQGLTDKATLDGRGWLVITN